MQFFRAIPAEIKNLKNPFTLFILFLIVIGTFFKLAPLFNNYRLAYSIIDDGYYMMTVARNIAIGKGMTISNGDIHTNGIQPLYTFILSILYWLNGGDKYSTLKFIVLLQFLISCFTFFLLWKLGTLVLNERKNGFKISLFAAALWFCNPVTYLNTTNGLETGIYTLSVLIPLLMIFSSNTKYNAKFSMLLGAVLGILFWVRNDIIFLVLSVVIFILYYKKYDSEKKIKNIYHILIIGLVSFLIALPWLIYNKINFGHIIPSSGQAQFLNTQTGGNFKHIPAVLVEYFVIFYQIPYYAKNNLVTILLCSIISFVLLVLCFKSYKSYPGKLKELFLIIFIFLSGLSLFYGFAFGTYFFLSRYLFPAASVAYIFWAYGAFSVLEYIKTKTLKYSIVTAFSVFMLAISIYNYSHDYQKVLFNFVDWIEKNLDGSQWVGSFQSGAIGYYYDKTINLDGKLNPEALAAIKEGKLLQYVVNKKLDYLIDVNSFAEWKNAELIDNYDLIVNDPDKQMAVFKRKK